MVTPQGTIPATGRTVEIVARNMMNVDDDAIGTLRISFDAGAFMHQLGL